MHTQSNGISSKMKNEEMLLGDILKIVIERGKQYSKRFWPESLKIFNF